jgi:hypothetical protein
MKHLSKRLQIMNDLQSVGEPINVKFRPYSDILLT